MSKANLIVVYKWECAVWCGECGSGRMWEWEIVECGGEKVWGEEVWSVV